MERSWNDGDKTQYYVVILDQLQGHSRGLVRAPELRVRGPLTFTPLQGCCAVTPLENFLWKCSMGYNLYPWISLLESTLETSYKPQT